MIKKVKFEDPANEIVYEIFEYFDYFQSYAIFVNLNQRFQNLFVNSTLPIQIHLGSISKPIVNFYYKNLILLNQHRIESLHLSNPFVIQFFFSSPSVISQFTHLQTLIIDDILTRDLEDLCKSLLFLSNLSSLILFCNYFIWNKTCLYQQIFRLSSLKYFKISIKEESNSLEVPFQTEQFSSITHLVIQDWFSLKE